MDILERIIADKAVEVAADKRSTSLTDFSSFALFDRKPQSVSTFLKERSGVIAEFKRKSPSKSDIRIDALVSDILPDYEKAGASACSVLTDKKYFGGSLDDLQQARALVDIPLLRKDFMIDPYQIHQAKAFGADIILLIAANLSVDQASELNDTAHELGMETILEVHSLEELEEFVGIHPDVVGVNNRNLKTFEVSLQTSLDIYPHIPSNILAISESGIHSHEDLRMLLDSGFDGGLIGEYFMRQPDPGKSLQEFIAALKTVKS